MNVAIQGVAGSFHHEAVQKWFGESSIVPCETFPEVFETLKNGNADVAIVAVENTLYGSIHEVLELLEKHRFPVTGEILLRIKQQLIALPDAELEEITRVYSHPVALVQCKEFLDNYLPGVERIEYPDTAASVEFIKGLNSPTVAAIAGKSAAKLYGLPILAENVEDNKANFTRFLVLDPRKPVENPDKFSLALTTDHAPGALAKCLDIFAAHDTNLTKLESRPIIGRPWKYKFYIDVEASSGQLTTAIKKIEKDGTSITVLGSYKAAKP